MSNVTIFNGGRKMFPSEMIILMAIAAGEDTGKKLLTRPMDITSEYIGYLYHSLVKRGYLKRHGSARYQLTEIGREALVEFLRKNGTRAQDVVKRLKLLGIEISPKQERELSKLEKEAIKVK
jgi:predicted transcriptional regulator